jgi:hypothetical protein
VFNRPAKSLNVSPFLPTYNQVPYFFKVKAYHMPVVTRSLSKSAEKEKEKEKKKEKESSESGKVKSKEGGEVEDGEHDDEEHNESDKADGQNYEETEEKKVKTSCFDCFLTSRSEIQFSNFDLFFRNQKR